MVKFRLFIVSVPFSAGNKYWFYNKEKYLNKIFLKNFKNTFSKMNLPSILPPHFHFPSPEATSLTSFLDNFSVILCAHICICRGRIIFQNHSTLNFNPRSQERLAAEEGNVARVTLQTPLTGWSGTRVKRLRRLPQAQN